MPANTVEGFWSIFKRGVVGTFHKVSAKCMALYVAEFQLRYNNRSNPDIWNSYRRMLKPLHIILSVAICFALTLDSQAQSQHPSPRSNAPSNNTAQPPTTDQRGTDQFPLAVKILPGPDAKARSEQEEREGRDKTENDIKLTAETQRIADYTWWLSVITLFLFFAAIGQIVVFYIQLRYMGEQLRFARRGVIDAAIAANAAKDSADAAVTSAEHLPRVERAYLFLAMEVESEIREFRYGDSTTRSKITFGLKNHGKTPAIVEELHTMARFWRESWPAMATAEGIPVQKGWAISAGETQGGYAIEFPLRPDEIEKAKAGDGYVLFWGKIVYRDVFKDVHESGWCRAYQFKGDGWRFAGDETLNYYT